MEVSFEKFELKVLTAAFVKEGGQTVVSLDDAPKLPKNVANGIVCIPSQKTIVISTLCKAVHFYDANSENFRLRVKLVDFPSSIAAVDYSPSSNNADVEGLLTCVETAGDVTVFKLNSTFFTDLADREAHRISTDPVAVKLNYRAIENGEFATITLARFAKQAKGFVNKVKFIPDVDVIVTCSPCYPDGHLSLWSLDGKRRCTAAVEHGVYDFDFMNMGDPVLSLLITGGGDCLLNAWSPLKLQKPTFALDGHCGPITHVKTDQFHLLAVSVSRDRRVNVWNLKFKCCVQTIDFSTEPLGSDYPHAVYYDQTTRRLFICTDSCIVYGPSPAIQKTTAHRWFVCCLLYSSTFCCVISIGRESRVTTWQISTGEMVGDFAPAHAMTKNGVELPAEVTDARLNESGKQLVTVGEEGCLKFWNFHTGVCLAKYCIPGGCRLSTVTFGVSRFLYVPVRDREFLQMTFVKPKLFNIRTWRTGMSRAVVSMDVHRRGGCLVLAAVDGVLTVWDIRKKRVICRLRDEGREVNAFAIKLKMKKDVSAAFQDAHIPQTAIETSRKFVTIASKQALATPGGTGKTREQESEKDVLEQRTWKMEQTLVKIMFLQNRLLEDHTASLVSYGGDGVLRFWATTLDSGILARFRASDVTKGSVVCSTTDDANRYLITGQDDGHLCVWLMAGYCDGLDESLSSEQLDYEMNKFPYSRLRWKLNRSDMDAYFQVRTGHSEERDPLMMVTDPPVLLSCFRAHCACVTSITYSTEHEMIVSGDVDGSVRMWHVTGCFVGEFGRDVMWNMKISTIIGIGKRNNMPDDIRRSASPATLKVLNKGHCPLWERALSVLYRSRFRYGYVPFWAKFFLKETDKRNRDAYELRKEERASLPPILGKDFTGRGRYVRTHTSVDGIFCIMGQAQAFSGIEAEADFVNLKVKKFNYNALRAQPKFVARVPRGEIVKLQSPSQKRREVTDEEYVKTITTEKLADTTVKILTSAIFSGPPETASHAVSPISAALKPETKKESKPMGPEFRAQPPRFPSPKQTTVRNWVDDAMLTEGPYALADESRHYNRRKEESIVVSDRGLSDGWQQRISKFDSLSRVRHLEDFLRASEELTSDIRECPNLRPALSDFKYAFKSQSEKSRLLDECLEKAGIKRYQKSPVAVTKR